MLGLVAMATSVDALYASMKALVCIVGNNEVALKEMGKNWRLSGRKSTLETSLHYLQSFKRTP